MGMCACSTAPPQQGQEEGQPPLFAHFLNQYRTLSEPGHADRSMPTYVKKDGSLARISLNDGATRMNWIIGFFPGTLWYLSELTGDSTVQQEARYYSGFLRDYLKGKKIDHDIGFIVNCTFGNEYRNGFNQELNKKEIIYWADLLIQRFNAKVGCFKSWNTDRSWIQEKGWQYPVIIDNMMNLELLFLATAFSGDSSYHNTAIIHANTTLKNHFREDYSSFHMVDYDTATGAVRGKETVQGFADSSAWSRGQAWGLYGYTMVYRFTKDRQYLHHAMGIADFILNHPNLPADKVPYWDFNVPEIPDTYRDASAASITASALFELYGYEPRQQYLESANTIINSLGSTDYQSTPEEHFILQHSVGSVPHNSGVDDPVNYADYYYLEALLRQQQISQ